MHYQTTLSILLPALFSLAPAVFATPSAVTNAHALDGAGLEDDYNGTASGINGTTYNSTSTVTDTSADPLDSNSTFSQLIPSPVALTPAINSAIAALAKAVNLSLTDHKTIFIDLNPIDLEAGFSAPSSNSTGNTSTATNTTTGPRVLIQDDMAFLDLFSDSGDVPDVYNSTDDGSDAPMYNSTITNVTTNAVLPGAKEFANSATSSFATVVSKSASATATGMP